MNDNVKPEAPLSGAQMSLVQKQLAVQAEYIRKDVDLRKWAVDQAIGLAGAMLENNASTAGKSTFDVIQISRAIHAFLTEAAGDKPGANQI
jgi:hypothetical protein